MQTIASAPTYEQPPAYPPPYEPPYQPPYQPPSYSRPGGGLHRFLGSGFGQAIVTGAGFGIGDDLINSIFR